MQEQVIDRGERSRSVSMGMMAGTAVFSRLLLNTARRFAYPFAPVISRGLGVPVTAVTSIIAVNQATGIMGMLFGPLADRFGYRRMMMAGLALLTLGMLAAGFLPFYGFVLVGLLLSGLGKNIFDPAIQAYVGEKVSFERRGRIIGLLETSWAGSTLVGIPLIGLLIHHWGWRAPFFLIGGLGILAMGAIWHIVPPDGKRRVRTGGAARTWAQLLRNRAAVAALAFGFLVSFANDTIFVVYGMWLEGFGLAVVALGMSTCVIGTAELAGEFLTATLSDRIGLKRAVLGGLLLSVAGYLLLPLASGGLYLALAALAFCFLAFEFTFVTFLTIATEITPGSRATMLSLFFAAAGIGRVLGALTGGLAWTFGGMAATAVIAAGATLMAFGCLAVGLKGWKKQE